MNMAVASWTEQNNFKMYKSAFAEQSVCRVLDTSSSIPRILSNGGERIFAIQTFALFASASTLQQVHLSCMRCARRNDQFREASEASQLVFCTYFDRRAYRE